MKTFVQTLKLDLFHIGCRSIRKLPSHKNTTNFLW